MAEQDEDEPALAARLAIGAIAGVVATMALTSAMRRLHRQLPDAPATGRAAGAGPELRLAISFAYGAACGAALAGEDGEDDVGVRIELAAVKERLKKLEAIASGVEL